MGSSASKLPKEIVEAFHALDTDGNGKVEIKELQDTMLQVYPRYGVEPYEIADLSCLVLRAADDDDSGSISIEEFAQNQQLQELVKEKLALDNALRSNLKKAKETSGVVSDADAAKVRAIFTAFDKDKSGTLDAVELKTIIYEVCQRAVTTQESRLILEEMDKDKSGQLSIDEVLEWWPAVVGFLGAVTNRK